MPAFSVSKLDAMLENAFELVNDIKEILESLDVKTSKPMLVGDYSYGSKKGMTSAVRLGIESNAENMFRFSIL